MAQNSARGRNCKPGASMSGAPPLERTKGPPENQQKPSLAYVTAASETQHSVIPPHLELTENPCNVMYKKVTVHV